MYHTITACTAPAFFCDLTSSNTSRSLAAVVGAPSSSSHSRPILVPFYINHEFEVMQKMGQVNGLSS